MADYFTRDYVKLENASYRVRAEEATIIGAGLKDDFVKRHDNNTGGYTGIAKDTFILLLEYDKGVKTKGIIFLKDNGIKIISDMGVAKAKDLEGLTLEALFQFDKMVGVRVP